MPEFFIVFSIATVLSIFVFYSQNLVTVGRVLSLQMGYSSLFILFVMSLLYLNVAEIGLSTLGSAGYRDLFSTFFAFLITIGSFFLLSVFFTYLAKNSLHEFEFILIILLILLGGYSIIFSNNFLGLYLGIELQSLGLYVLAGMKTNAAYSTEAALKYFVLGAFASSLLIFGIAFYYGVVGLYSFPDIRNFNINGNFIYNLAHSGTIFSLIFIFSSLFFKVGSAPFHMWVPDVYEGVPIIVTAFFSAIPKLSIFSLLIRFFYDVYSTYSFDFSLLFMLSGVLSVFIGSVGAIGQHKTKRLISYSAIAHTGFLIFGISIGTFESLVAVLFYLVIYLSLTLALFSNILGMQHKVTESALKLVGNLSYIYKSNFFIALGLVFCVFSIAGVPPLSGFFSKLLIFVSSISAGYYTITLFVILLSVVSSVYYLKIIRSLVFSREKRGWLLFNDVNPPHAYSISFLTLFNVLFAFFAVPLYYTVINIALNFSL